MTSSKGISIEPQPAIFRVLCANLALNNLYNSGSVSLLPNASGHPVEIVPVDALCASLSALRLLKIDVEGMEHAKFDVSRLREITDPGHHPLRSGSFA